MASSMGVNYGFGGPNYWVDIAVICWAYMFFKFAEEIQRIMVWLETGWACVVRESNKHGKSPGNIKWKAVI